MKYLVCFLILVIGAITITECAPSPMKQYEDFVKFLQFIGMICRNKKIDEKRLGEILEDPIFYKKYVPEKSDMSISQIQMLICPKDSYANVNRGMTQTNSKVMKFTNGAISTTFPQSIFTSDNFVVLDTQDKTAKDSVLY